jgi:hypothetical protein
MTKPKTSAQTNKLYILVEPCRKPNGIGKREPRDLYSQPRIHNLVAPPQRTGDDWIVGETSSKAHKVVRPFRIH